MRKIRRLGLFDSGLGGYTVFHDLKKNFPEMSLVLYADQKHAPYGNRSDEDIIGLVKEAMAWFSAQGIVDVLLACNTATSVAYKEIVKSYPQMRIVGIIDLTVKALGDDAKHVGVFATHATVSSHAYAKMYHTLYFGEIVEVSLPLLVSGIEAMMPMETLELMVQEGLNKMPGRDYIILGCTHFPLVRQLFEKNTQAQIVDSLAPIREYISNRHESDGLPKHVVYTTGSAETMKKQIKSLFEVDEEVVEI